LSESVTTAILAGGEGTRFRPYTDLIPKPMIPVGPEERPILEYIVRWLAKHGFNDIVLLVGYKWRQIANYFGDGSRWGVRIRYSLDTETYRGTGGALLNAYRQGLLGDGTVLVWYGDILAPLNPRELLQAHRSSGATVTLALADRYQVPVGVARVDSSGNVVELREKPWLNLYVTIGVLALEARALEGVEEELGGSFDVMGDLIPWMLRRGLKVKAYVYRGPWYDVGSLERYQKLPVNQLVEVLGV
jgi:mannose-1-phosphate guanylyltransferase